MPARMAINIESRVGCNNQLQQAVPGMKLGITDEVNTNKKVGAAHMEGMTKRRAFLHSQTKVHLCS